MPPPLLLLPAGLALGARGGWGGGGWHPALHCSWQGASIGTSLLCAV